MENIGLSEILYVQGNSNKLIPVLKKYGTPTISNINQSDTFQINTNIVLVICYLSIFIVNIYPQAESLIPRARFYVSTFAIQEALFGVETGDKEAFYSGIAPYL